MTYIRFFIASDVIYACHCCDQPVQHCAIECTVPTKIVDAQLEGEYLDSSIVMDAAKWDGSTLTGLEFTNQVHVMDFVPEPKTSEELAEQARAQRNQMLAESDWTQLPDARASMGEAKAAEWDAYRQALRDITDQAGFPADIVWPTKPE